MYYDINYHFYQTKKKKEIKKGSKIASARLLDIGEYNLFVSIL